jgi:large subunit ribosomal protein L32
MAVPKRRKSKSKTRKGRSHQAMTAPPVVSCPHCESACLPHRVCPNCGKYAGRQVVALPEAEAE